LEGLLTSEEEVYLRKRGWKQAETLSPYRWYDAKYPGAYYRLKDALDVARGLEKERSGGAHQIAPRLKPKLRLGRADLG